MEKRTLLLSLILITLVAGNSCKKENSNTKSALAGKYVLMSRTDLNTETGVTETYTSTASPCMSDVQTTLKDDGTWAAAYVGAEDCIVSRTSNGIIVIGSKGEAGTGSWSVSSSSRIKFIFSSNNTSFGQISNAGGKVYLTFKDTSQSYISTSVLIKQ